ncbi:MAG: 50S ribosomal protein L25, partial [Pseudomonadota bacterium]|nr:50S ribosomal protein L25 [Pseudomonadota bacterium]
MSQTVKIVAEPREKAGKGTARATRREGRVPAVLYGAKEAPVMISLESKDLEKRLKNTAFYSHIC